MGEHIMLRWPEVEVACTLRVTLQLAPSSLRKVHLIHLEVLQSRCTPQKTVIYCKHLQSNMTVVVIRCQCLTNLVPVKLSNGSTHRELLLTATMECQRKTSRRMSMPISVPVVLKVVLKRWTRDHLPPLPKPLPLLLLLSSL